MGDHCQLGTGDRSQARLDGGYRVFLRLDMKRDVKGSRAAGRGRRDELAQLPGSWVVCCTVGSTSEHIQFRIFVSGDCLTETELSRARLGFPAYLPPASQFEAKHSYGEDIYYSVDGRPVQTEGGLMARSSVAGSAATLSCSPQDVRQPLEDLQPGGCYFNTPLSKSRAQQVSEASRQRALPTSCRAHS